MKGKEDNILFPRSQLSAFLLDLGNFYAISHILIYLRIPSRLH